jgi:hypothetical protein
MSSQNIEQQVKFPSLQSKMPAMALTIRVRPRLPINELYRAPEK